MSQWANFYAYHITQKVQEALNSWHLREAERMAEEGDHAHDKVKQHHQDDHGMFLPYELLRREVFRQWAVDKGLLRGILRHVVDDLHGGRTLADFGAGGGILSSKSESNK